MALFPTPPTKKTIKYKIPKKITKYKVQKKSIKKKIQKYRIDIEEEEGSIEGKIHSQSCM